MAYALSPCRRPPIWWGLRSRLAALCNLSQAWGEGSHQATSRTGLKSLSAEALADKEVGARQTDLRSFRIFQSVLAEY